MKTFIKILAGLGIFSVVGGGITAHADKIPFLDDYTTNPAVRMTTPGNAMSTLESLPVKGRAASTGYKRSLFPHWKNSGGACNADMESIKRYANVELGSKCREVAGVMIDPYSGKQLKWGRLRTNVIDIDHIVSLRDAYVKGGAKLSASKKKELANDPLNLVPVSAKLNRQKGDSDAATWLPPRVDVRCWYVSSQIAVKKKYGLNIALAEKEAMRKVLETCSNYKLITVNDKAPQ